MPSWFSGRMGAQTGAGRSNTSFCDFFLLFQEFLHHAGNKGWIIAAHGRQGVSGHAGLCVPLETAALASLGNQLLGRMSPSVKRACEIDGRADLWGVQSRAGLPHFSLET